MPLVIPGLVIAAVLAAAGFTFDRASELFQSLLPLAVIASGILLVANS
ncbi:MAG: hypothetical protein AAFQ04_08670 [Pseudomonadota bacterium]